MMSLAHVSTKYLLIVGHFPRSRHTHPVAAKTWRVGLELLDRDAAAGKSLHDHGSFLVEQDHHLSGGASPFAASTHPHVAAV